MAREKKEYQVCVIGNSWSASLLANKLSRQNDVLYIKTTPSQLFSGSTKKFQGSFETLPHSEDALASINWLKSEFQLDFEFIENSSPYKTIDSGKKAEFLGFADRKGSSIASLSWYNEKSQISLNSTFKEIENKVFANFEGDLFEAKEVTSLNITDGHIDSIEVNGSKTFKASHVYYCDAPANLLNIIKHDDFPEKNRKKIIKNKPLSSIQVIYQHKSDFENQNSNYMLMGNNEDFEPCIGHFFKDKQGLPEETLFSQWMSLLPHQQAEDIEKITSHLKNMKRQIKRAYPEFFDSIEFEKVLVQDQSYGQVEIGSKDPHKIDGISNLILSSPLFLSSNDFIAGIDITKIIEENYFPAIESETPAEVGP